MRTTKCMKGEPRINDFYSQKFVCTNKTCMLHLYGRVKDNKKFCVDLHPKSWSSLERAYAWSVSRGGRWKPCDCRPRSKLALIIPFRDRFEHLSSLLNNIIPFLQYQRRHFQIFLVEQVLLPFFPSSTHHVLVNDMWRSSDFCRRTAVCSTKRPFKMPASSKF